MVDPKIVVYYSGGSVMHSGKVKELEVKRGKVDEARTIIESKWGTAPLATHTLSEEIATYGKYACYAKKEAVGCCEPSANELPW